MATRVLTTSKHMRNSMEAIEKEDLSKAQVPSWLIKALSPRKIFKILVPLDGSEFAEDALTHLGNLTEKFGEGSSEIILLRVIEPFAPPYRYPPRMPMDFKEYLQWEKEQAADICVRYLAKIQKRLSKSGLNSRYVVLDGLPIHVISQYARRNDIDLIVMSSHGRTGIKRWIFGSITEKVIHNSVCPVFAVRGLNDRSIILHVNVI